MSSDKKCRPKRIGSLSLRLIGTRYAQLEPSRIRVPWLTVIQALEALKEGIVDWLGGLEEALTHVDELKLVEKAQEGMSGKKAYGDLKREMWRETVDYLENFGAEDGRDFRIQVKKDQEKEASERKVKEWEAKAKL